MINNSLMLLLANLHRKMSSYSDDRPLVSARTKPMKCVPIFVPRTVFDFLKTIYKYIICIQGELL